MKILIRKRGSSKDSANDGQAMVEFALTVPLFLAMFLGFILFGMMFYSYLTVNLSSREGAGFLVRDPKQTVAAVKTRVAETSISLDKRPSAFNVKVEPTDPANWLPGVKINVTVVYTVPIPIITIPNLKGPATQVFGPIPVSSTSVMTIE